MRNHWTEIEKYLEDQKIAQELIGELRDFHMRYEVKDQVKERVEKPDILFYGKKILEMSIAALLQGDNLLLSGAKATGKNVLCETLAWIFGRPEYDISFHVNTDSADLIGTDTFIIMRFAFGKAPSTNVRNLEDLESWTKSIWQKMMRFLYCMPHWIIGAESIFQDITGFYFIRQHDLSAR